MNNEEYCYEFGSRCPYCNSPDVNKTSDISNESDGTASRDCYCDECNKHWGEIWKMEGFDDYEK